MDGTRRPLITLAPPNQSLGYASAVTVYRELVIAQDNSIRFEREISKAPQRLIVRNSEVSST